MNTLPFQLSDALLHAFGWTLLHTLWQGAAIAVGLLLLLPRLRSARLRYRAAYAGLLTMLAAALTTFALMYQPESAGQVLAENGTVLGRYFIEINEQADSSGLWANFVHWLEVRHPLFVTLWLLGFAFFLVRLIGGFFWVQQLRKRAMPQPLQQWTDKLTELAGRLGQRREVTLRESAQLRSPLTVGWLKPLILFPIGLINQIDPAEVEAILAHELAHVVRRDWLLNLVQAFVEALFYYHPAIWWISAVVRAERENCCDDVAVSLTGNRLAYAKALVRVQEMARLQGPTPVLALGAAGASTLLRRRPMLLERIQRILNQQHKKSQLMEKFIATTLLAALVALWGARPQQAEQLTAALGEIATAPLTWFSETPREEPAIAPTALADTDTVPPALRKTTSQHTQKIVQENDEGRVEMDVQDGEITRLNINGRDIPPAEYAQHQALTAELIRDVAPVPPTPPAPAAAFGWNVPPTPPSATSPTTAPFAYMMPPTAPTAAGSATHVWVNPDANVAFTMPSLGGLSSLTTEKDDQGNTVIRVMSGGQPTEIVVKGTEVFVDGEKVQEGATVPMGELSPLRTTEGQAFSFGEGQSYFFPSEGLREMNAEEMKAFQESRKQMEKELKKQQKELRKQQKGMNKEQRETMERAQRDKRRAELDMQRNQEEMARVQGNLYRAQGNLYRIQADSRSNDFGSVMKAELRRDGLLPDPNHYSMSLNNKELVVNGKKQPAPLHRKYLELYREKTGQELGEDGNINLVENRD